MDEYIGGTLSLVMAGIIILAGINAYGNIESTVDCFTQTFVEIETSSFTASTTGPPLMAVTTHDSSTSLSTGFTFRRSAEEVVSTASLIYDLPVTSVTLALSRSTSVPSGNATIGVWDSAGTLVKVFGTKDVSTITQGATEYTFVSTPYRLQAGDRIGAEYTGGNSTLFIRVHHNTANPFDGTTSILSRGVTTWTSEVTGSDARMTLLADSSPVANVDDNDIATYWQNNGTQEASAYLYADLGSSQAISSVFLNHPSAPHIPSQVSVYVADDPGSFGSAVATQSLTSSTGEQEIAFDATGRYVKVQVDTWDAAKSWRVGEFDVEGPEAGVVAFTDDCSNAKESTWLALQILPYGLVIAGVLLFVGGRTGMI